MGYRILLLMLTGERQRHNFLGFYLRCILNVSSTKSVPGCINFYKIFFVCVPNLRWNELVDENKSKVKNAFMQHEQRHNGWNTEMTWRVESRKQPLPLSVKAHPLGEGKQS